MPNVRSDEKQSGGSLPADAEIANVSAPATAKFGETMRIKGGPTKVGDVTVRVPTPTTGTAEYPGAAGTLCMIPVTLVAVEAASNNGYDIDDEEVPPGETLEGFASFEVPEGKVISSIEMDDATLDLAATWQG